jgi:fumarate reductase flavoprotein subunit
MEKELSSKSKAGKIKISRSWTDIAGFIGVSSAELRKTVDEYNRYCEQGYDETFLKEKRYLVSLKNPPYYVVPVGIQCMLTHGGIRINEKAEVVTPEDKPIPGLYAAGVETGGKDGDTYNMNLSGHSSSFAIGGGRIAGEEAARYIKTRK